MRFISGSDLALELRQLCDAIESRLWIACPFIGAWSAVRSVLGTRWLDHGEISVRLLTDDAVPACLNPATLAHFSVRGIIRLLPGIHAKLYITDDQALLTSANLTETAFTKRHEAGVLLDANEAKPLIELFTTWWTATSIAAPDGWLARLEQQAAGSGQRNPDESGWQTLPLLWTLPPDPGSGKLPRGEFATYRVFLKYYREFSDLYFGAQRLWPATPLYLETDGLLDYLFHHAPGYPSKRYYRDNTARPLTDSERLTEISLRAAEYAAWAKQSADDQNWRYARWQDLKPLLTEAALQSLSWENAGRVVRSLHCMTSLPLHIAKFLNPQNNTLETIRDSWLLLLHGSGPVEQRMQQCCAPLISFGKSSAQELLGWSNPHQFPLRNSNSDSGLRYFGYAV